MPKQAASCSHKPFVWVDYAFKGSKRGNRIRKVFKPVWVSANLPLTFALLVWELASFPFPLTSLSRILTMITWPRLHDITASFNAHGRSVLKIPHDYRLTAVSSEHQLHSWCPWETERIHRFHIVMRPRNTLTWAGHFLYCNQMMCVLTLYIPPSYTTDMQLYKTMKHAWLCGWKYTHTPLLMHVASLNIEVQLYLQMRHTSCFICKKKYLTTNKLGVISCQLWEVNPLLS